MSHDLVLFEHPEWQKPQIHTGSAAALLRLQQGGPAVSPLREGCITSFMRFYGPRWKPMAASPPGVSVGYTSPVV
jgi:hypothetical protein